MPLLHPGWWATALLLPALLTQCDRRQATAPTPPSAPAVPDELRAIAVRLRVDLTAQRIHLVAQRGTNPNVSMSLVGTDGVQLTTSNLTRTALNPRRSLIRFDVAITNALSNVALAPPTFPAPPAGSGGVLLFPLEAMALQGSPRTIAPSAEWDGAPHNFFNDAGCTGASSTDCLRWEEFAAPIAPGATSEVRTVGFEMDADIDAFEVAMLVAADLHNVEPPALIIVSSPSVALAAAASDPSPASHALSITNGGGGTLGGLTTTVSYGDNQPGGWLTATLGSTSAPTTLTLDASAGSLAAGTYTGTVAVDAGEASNSPQSVAVTFTVAPGPAISLSTTEVDFRSVAGTVDPPGATVQITNSGGGTLTGLSVAVTYAEGQPSGWLATDLVAASAPSVLLLSAFASNLPNGTYTATASISAAGASNSPQTIEVTLQVSESAVSADAIYVSVSDPAAIDDGGCGLGPVGSGTGHYPCRTIAQGFARARQTGRGEVRVADGRYTEAVGLDNGTSLLGGYEPSTWARNVEATNTIIDGVSSSGNHDRTVVAANITSPTLFEGFVVRGSVNTKPSGNSYAVYVSGSNGNLVIRRNVIYAGVGGRGSSGAAGLSPSAAPNGLGRDSDPMAYDGLIATGVGPCSTSNDRSHTNGGVNVVSGDEVSGGHGGGNRCPPSSNLVQFSALNGVTGQSGASVLGGSAGAGGVGGSDARLEDGGVRCVLPSLPVIGAHGARGAAGGNGGPVSGGASQTGGITGGHWVGTSGTNGIAGGNGGGGGGGGAGGGAYCLDCMEGKDRLGGHGGGGGAGGGGGGGGARGNAGGGAFGIVVIGGEVVLTENDIVRGQGGAGGDGGTGAPGGAGGVGGAGGLGSVFCTGEAGDGGDGGRGGTGSGGGGGSGGVSYGILTSGIGTPAYCLASSGNTIDAGAGGDGGAGGPSPVNPGAAGPPGELAACSFR